MSNNPDNDGDRTMNTTVLEYALDYDLSQARQDVDAYVRDQLAGRRRNSFELFLLNHPELQDEVEAALVARQGLQSVGKAVALAEVEKDGTGESRPGLLQRLFGALPAVPALATAALLVLTIAIGSLMFRAPAHPLISASMPAGVAYQTISLPNVRAGFNGDFQPLAVLDPGSGDGWMMMRLELSFPEFERYNVEILSWPRRDPLLAVNNLVPDSEDNLNFALHASELQAGDYIARVVYDSGSREEVVANYAFSVKSGKGSNI